VPLGDGRHAADGASLASVGCSTEPGRKKHPLEPDDLLGIVCVSDLGSLPWRVSSRRRSRGVGGANDGPINVGQRGSLDTRRP
jgi:hypothetical protein